MIPIANDYCEICGYDLYDSREHIWIEQSDGSFKILCVDIIMLEDDEDGAS